MPLFNLRRKGGSGKGTLVHLGHTLLPAAPGSESPKGLLQTPRYATAPSREIPTPPKSAARMESLHANTKDTAHAVATRLSNSWMHGKGNTTAVLWTKPNTEGGKGLRYEGTHVTPFRDKDGGAGVLLHNKSLASQRFYNHSVADVQYVNPNR